MAYRTTPRSITSETPFSLVFGSEAVIPSEIQGQAFRITHFEPEDNEELLRTDSALIEERREEARARYNLYRSQVQEAFNRKVKKLEFQVGELVLRQSNALLDIGKLEAAWEGPYKLTRVLRGGSYELIDMEGNELPRPWHIS